jgi:hypothetical protein
MKMSEIKVGEEYAIGLREYDQRHPKQAIVIEKGVERHYSVGGTGRRMPVKKKADDGVRVRYLNTDGRPIHVSSGGFREETVIARAVMQPWREWVEEQDRYRAARSEYEEKQAAERAALNDRLSAVRQRLPEGEKVEWVRHNYGIEYGMVALSLEAVERMSEAEAQLAALLDTGALQVGNVVAEWPRESDADRRDRLDAMGTEQEFEEWRT